MKEWKNEPTVVALFEDQQWDTTQRTGYWQENAREYGQVQSWRH